MLKKITANILKFALFAIVLWYIYRSIDSNLSKIKNIDFRQYDPKFVFFSVVTMFVSLIYPVFVWKFLVRSLGDKINTLSALKIWFISNLGRYVPGKVLQIAGLVFLAGKEGVTKSKAVQSVLYSQITANGLGLFMGLGLLLLKTTGDDFPNLFHITTILIAVFILILWFPTVFLRSSNFVLGKMNKEKLENTLGTGNYLKFLALQIINWMLMSLSFILLVKTYTNISVTEHPEVLFILPLSWTIGLLAIFAPGGIGVREGAMTFWLKNYVPLEYALVLPWIYRILITVVETILTIIFTLSYRKPQRDEKQAGLNNLKK
jgi:glycosyltransferase 2 family protein